MCPSPICDPPSLPLSCPMAHVLDLHLWPPPLTPRPDPGAEGNIFLLSLFLRLKKKKKIQCFTEINVSRSHPLNTWRGKCWMCRVSLHHSANIPIVWHSDVFEGLHFNLACYLNAHSSCFEWFENTCLRKCSMLFWILDVCCFYVYNYGATTWNCATWYMFFQMLEMLVGKPGLNYCHHNSRGNEKSCLALHWLLLLKKMGLASQ